MLSLTDAEVADLLTAIMQELTDGELSERGSIECECLPTSNTQPMPLRRGKKIKEENLERNFEYKQRDYETADVNKDLIGRRCECINLGMIITGVIEGERYPIYGRGKVRYDEPQQWGQEILYSGWSVRTRQRG